MNDELFSNESKPFNLKDKLKEIAEVTEWIKEKEKDETEHPA